LKKWDEKTNVVFIGAGGINLCFFIIKNGFFFTLLKILLIAKKANIKIKYRG